MHAELARLVDARRGGGVPLSRDDRLEADLGLKSLDLVELGARLVPLLGANPLTPSFPWSQVRTVGDLCAACAAALNEAVATPGPDDPLLAASRARADARRRRQAR